MIDPGKANALFRLLGAFIDAVLAHGSLTDEALARIDTAIMREEGGGWNQSLTARVMSKRGWTSAEDIYDEAGVPDHHRDVIDLALYRDPKYIQSGFTDEDIARYTGHPERTVRLWIYNGRERLRKLDRGDLAGESGIE